MNTKEFVEKLKYLTPEKESLRSRGLSDQYIEELIQSYNCESKGNDCNHSDALLMLVDCYHADVIRIGGMEFREEVEEIDRFHVVGDVEVDRLVIDKTSGIVKVIDENENHDMWDCADNGSKFLEAILEAAKFLIKRSDDENLYNNREATDAVAEACAQIAGGDRYLDFYRMLVGSW